MVFPAGQHRRETGYTLMEMLLVLGVIAAFVSMTVPSIMRIFHEEKLTASAEKIRTAVATARVRAIESGLIYQFCCEANGTHFAVVPFEPDHLGTVGNNSSGGTPASAAAVASHLGRYAGNLPKGIRLNSAIVTVAGGTLTTTNATVNAFKIAPNALDGLPNASDLASLNWSAPLLFNSDGSASSDTDIIVSDDRSQHIRIRVRAFTGSAAMGRIYTEKR